MLQLNVPDAHSFRIPAVEAQGFTPSVLGRAVIFSDENVDGFQDRSRVGCPREEVVD
jgi:hypothetical protein